MAAGKIRWGELEEDDGGDLDFLIPPCVVIGPDENGFKKTIEYRFDDDSNKVKVTTTRVLKLAHARLSKAAVERRNRRPEFLPLELRVLYFLAGEAVFMLIVVLCMLLCIIFGTMMYTSPLTVLVERS